MRFLFFGRKDEEEYYQPPRERKKQTLTQLADKILMKKMKDDPVYGVAAAERIKRISREPEKSLSAQLKELKELQGILRGFGTEGGEGGGSLLRDVISVLPDILQALPGALQNVRNQQLPPAERIYVFRDKDGSVQQLSEAEFGKLLQEPKPKKPEPEVETPTKLSDLAQFLDEEPETTFELLKAGYPGWVRVLSVQSVQGILDSIKPFVEEDPDIKEIYDRISSDSGRQWLEKLIKLAKQQGETEEKSG